MISLFWTPLAQNDLAAIHEYAAEMVLEAVTHEIRHWAQVATFLRMSGRRPSPRDFLLSPVVDQPEQAPGATH